MLANKGRMLSVVVFVFVGGLGALASSQPWVAVTMRSTQEVIEVAGAQVLQTLAPLSLAVLAMAGALAISGLVARYLIGTLGLMVSVWLSFATFALLPEPELQAVSSVLTELTGLAGTATLTGLVEQLAATVWPSIALILWMLLALASLLVLFTARHWRAGGRRFQAATAVPAKVIDPIDSWDELTRGSDPTSPEG